MAATSVSDKVPPGAQPSNRLDAGALARIGDLTALLSERVDPQCGAHVIEPPVIGAQHGVGKGDEQRAVRNIAVAAGTGQQIEIVTLAFCVAALTEQGCMRGGSIETLVEDRDTPGNQLDLRMGDGAVLVGEITHPSAR